MSDFIDPDAGGRGLILLPSTTITTAVTATTTTPIVGLYSASSLILQAKFVYGSGGTNAKFWVQTSLDRGVTWIDIINFAFTTATATKVQAMVANLTVASFAPGDAALADDTQKNGILGDRLRLKYTTTGTYAASTSIYISGITR